MPHRAFLYSADLCGLYLLESLVEHRMFFEAWGHQSQILHVIAMLMKNRKQEFDKQNLQGCDWRK